MTDNRTIINPADLHDPRPFGYSHIVFAPGETVYLAGQYASDADGQVAVEGFAAQVELSLENLRRALTAVGLGFENVVRLGSFIVDHDEEKLAVLNKALRYTWGERLPAQTLSGVATLALPGMLVEIDAIAVRPAP
ncbi:RidA family protein [Kitasatospora sp. NPDC008115]|uniref:RidA family protein n=1 Tax=Kitasatospora sp. NPDC008115 TaxID=3364022 RepID=UPI0036DFA66D